MSFHRLQNFVNASIIDQLSRLNHPQRTPSGQEESFSFQRLPEDREQRRITKHPYLEDEEYESSMVEAEGKEIQRSGVSGQDFFEDVEDFHLRRGSVSSIQKRYLSVLSSNSPGKESVKFQRVISSHPPLNWSFSNKQRPGSKEPRIDQSPPPKEGLFGGIIKEFRAAFTHCCAALPSTQKVSLSLHQLRGFCKS